MSSSGECGWCHDDRGLCDRPHLDDDRRFSIKLEETFEVEMVRNDDKYFFFKCLIEIVESIELISV